MWWWKESSEILCRQEATREIEKGMQGLDVPYLRRRILEHGFSVLDGVLGVRACDALRQQIRSIDAQGRLKPGNVVHGRYVEYNASRRGDRSCFVTTGQGKTTDVDAAIGVYLQQADKLRSRLTDDELSAKLVGGMDDCSGMCAIYPGGGARYVKHRDALPYRPGRKLTLIYYSNDEWVPESGGELQLWLKEGRDPIKIAPLADRLVVFISSLEHEVLPSWQTRLSLTVWMYNRRDQALEALAEDLRDRKSRGEFDAKEFLRQLDEGSDSSDGDEPGGGRFVDARTARAVMKHLIQRRQGTMGNQPLESNQ